MSKDIAQIHKLKEDILAGNTTYSDVERRLSAAIEAEYDREDANIDFINACEDLLLEMHTDGELPSFPTSEEYAIEMQKHMLVKKERSFLPKLAWRCAAVLAAMLVIVLLGDQVFHWQWFSGTSTEDEQQYVIQSHHVDVQMIQNSIAEHIEESELSTDSFEEVVAFLGFVPKVPDMQEIDATTSKYVVLIEPDMITLSARYMIGEEVQRNNLLYTIQFCTNTDDTYMLYEQDGNGDTHVVNGTEVYITPNVERTTYTWLEDTTIYRLVCDNEMTLSKILAEQIIGGTENAKE